MKRHSTLAAKLARCRKGSRRWKRLKRRKAQASAQFYRQQRHILHTASKRLADFAQQQGVTRLALGDVRDIANGPDKGRHTNQKLAQWARGKFEAYVRYKVQRFGCITEHVPEDYSTRTCNRCTHLHACAPRGRIFRCARPGCGAICNRDANAGAGYPLGDLFARPLWFLWAHCGAQDHVSARLCRSAQDTGQEFTSCC